MPKNVSNSSGRRTEQQKKILSLCICLFVCVSGYSQLGVLKNIEENRFLGQTYLYKEKYDSAYTAIGRFVENETFANPYDYLNFSMCCYKRNDTTTFLKYLNKAIQGGVDSIKVKSYLRKLTGNDKAFLENYLTANYEEMRKKGWSKYDTVLIKEVNSIEHLDQFARNEMMQSASAKADSNYSYLAFFQKQADSINYARVARLIELGKFPGYHNCGAFASLTISLIHLGDYHEDEWEYLFKQLKIEVLTGNILPIEVATIADNHYERGNGQLCSYYGHWIGRTATLCNCKEVDKYRAAIGLEDLLTEYKARDRTLPDCYEPAEGQKNISGQR
ncbi:MAG: hypothetical protein JSS96_03920 [Bacteroidetes bacterium]|nr:hypothetical protein [Bacteroidota bacterium]